MKENILHEIYKGYETPVLSIITGPPRVGKSWTGMRMGEILDGYFNLENIIFTPDQFINKIKELHDRSDMGQGRILLIDDIGGWNFGRYSSPSLGKLVPFCMQLTLASLICTTRDAYFLEPNVRGAAAHILMVHPFNRRVAPKELQDKNCVTWYDAKPNPDDGGKRIYVRPKVRGKRLERLLFGKPSESLTATYEEKVDMVKNALLDTLLAEAGERFGIRK